MNRQKNNYESCHLKKVANICPKIILSTLTEKTFINVV